ncbi:copper/silver-translocating P-type ATPase [Burkholderiales bacterium JOSHI_001]|nr:copper/silver-translocating P-type ATPase [Burkholderiales bacterium JOSHI_001]
MNTVAAPALLQLPVSGMTCASCVARVEKALAKVPGVQGVQVNLATEQAAVQLADGASAGTVLAALDSAVQRAGYALGHEAVTLQVDGMTCASCVARVEKALLKVPGVGSASVNLATNTAQVQRLAGSATTEALLAALARAGYEGHAAPSDGTPQRPADAGGWRVALALALSAPLVLPMLGDAFGLHWMLPAWWQFALATPVVFGLGWRFFRAGWGALRAGAGNMDLLVALGTGAAWALSLALWASDTSGMPHLYFESAAVVVSLVLLGKWMEARAKHRTLAALDALRALRPDTARVRRGGVDQLLPLAEVRLGDEVLVGPGERIAVDGDILEGASHVDESLLTGESLPVPRDVGQRVTGGAINGEGLLRVRTTAIGAETTLARIVRLVESAQAKKPAIQQTVDRVAAVFVPVVLGIAALTFVGWWALRGDAAAALIHAVSVLVIACPCALGLATPATLMVGTGLAARLGILVRDPQALELMRAVKVVAFDKTGTLTEGRPQLQGLAADDDTQALRQAASLQQGSAHPLARALHDAAGQRALVLPAASAVQAVPGRGVQGTVDGRSLVLGSGRWLDELGLAPRPQQAQADAWAAQGLSVSWLADTGSAQVLAALAFGDALKARSAPAIAALHALGVKTVLVSGDHRGAAQAAAQALGMDEVRAEVLPADKAAVVAALRQGLQPGQRVAMVGDGINDAPALAAADVGLAMATGTDSAMESAGLTLMRGDPMLVVAALQLSQAVTRRIHQNLFWAFAYNVVGIPLAAFGLLNPMVAGAAMALSSVSVVSNALLLGRWRPATPPT